MTRYDSVKYGAFEGDFYYQNPSYEFILVLMK